MTEETYKMVIEYHERIKELEALKDYLKENNCSLSFAVNTQKGKRIVSEERLQPIRNTLNQYSDVIIHEIERELATLKEEIGRL